MRPNIALGRCSPCGGIAASSRSSASSVHGASVKVASTIVHVGVNAGIHLISQVAIVWASIRAASVEITTSVGSSIGNCVCC